jgi:hypothetical protein
MSPWCLVLEAHASLRIQDSDCDWVRYIYSQLHISHRALDEMGGDHTVRGGGVGTAVLPVEMGSSLDILSVYHEN